MALIKIAETGFYRIPLAVALSDSTHGEIKAFELLTCRVRDSDGAEGVGYTYTVGRNGGAIADVLRREIPELIEGREADDTEAIGITSGGPCITADAADHRCSRSRRLISRCGT
jgi:L-alanine-DL-glutamate epimerase-like enolase superfamily enzyme